MPRKAVFQASAERIPAHQGLRGEGVLERPLHLAGVTFPPFDQLAVRRPERVRRPAALHRRLGIGHPVVERGHCRRDRTGVPREGRAMPGERRVLEGHRLFRLVEHRGELEIGRELTVDGVHRLGELDALARIGRERARQPADGRGDCRNDGCDDKGHAVNRPMPVVYPLVGCD